MAKYSVKTTAADVAADYKEGIKGKVVIVTGASAGIGVETALVLAKHGAKVIMAARTMDKLEKAAQSVRIASPSADLVLLHLDLASFASIKTFVDEFNKLNVPLHILIHNAGIMALPKYQTSVDGHELQYATNMLGPFLLTKLLTPNLKASAPSRVVCVSSMAIHCSYGKVPTDAIDDPKVYYPWRRYGESKLALSLFAKELQRRFEADNVDIIVTSLHPGAITNTDLSRSVSALSTLGEMNLPLLKLTFTLPFVGVPEGTATTIYCALSPDAVPGAFHAYCQSADDTMPALSDAKLAARVWECAERMTSNVTN